MDTTPQPPPINLNLTTPTLSYKDILIGKLVRCIACCVISQVIILFLYILVANISLLQPTQWLYSIFETFTFVSTWIFVIIFSFIIFAQSLICAKDYVLMTSYSSTRFEKFLHVFSLHNFILLSLHIIVGGVFTWQILVVIDSKNKNLTVACQDHTCFVSEFLFLIIGGFWTGFYFFLKVYMSSKQVIFPVIQQNKFLRFRSNVTILFKESLAKSIWPTLYFVTFYYLWGSQIEMYFSHIVGIERAPRESSFLLYVFLWWFAALYFFNMNLMRFFFYMFLTERIEFPVVKENNLTLQEALILDSLPIVQNLACLDLFLLAQWSPIRRYLFFTLSQPGGHPHNWNLLVESVVKIFNDYTELLKKSHSLPQEFFKKQPQIAPFSPLQLPIDNLKYRNLRNMSLHQDYLDIIDVSHQNPASSSVENLKKNIDEKIVRSLNFVKVLLGINFLFGPLPEVNIQKCLGNGQLIIWTSQGISELVVASLREDKYGIVQKDLPIIINSLVQLKQHLDKLNKMPILSKKIDDFNYKMKNAIQAAVKHSLFNICLNFGQYFNDLPLNKEVMQYLQTNIIMKNFE